MTSPVIAAAVSVPEQRRSASVEALPITPFEPSKLLPSWAAFRADDETLRVTVDDDAKWATVERALAYGLWHAGGRRLAMDLAPFRGGAHDPVQATRVRASFLSVPVDVYDGGHLTDPLDEGTALGHAVEDRLHSEVCDLGNWAAWLEPLIAWADRHPELESAHRKQYLSWHCAGRQLLQIKRTGNGLLVTAGVDYSRPQQGQASALKEKIKGTLSTALLSRLMDTVEAGITARLGSSEQLPTDVGHPEHRMQAAMGKAPELLGWEKRDVLRREFAVRRPGGGLGFIDFLRVDSRGVLHIVETKIGHDAMLVLQGLDYWIWVKANRKALELRLGTEITDVVIDYVVASKDDHPYDAEQDRDGRKLLSPYNLAHLRALRPDIRWRVHALSGWQSGRLVITALGQQERDVPGGEHKMSEGSHTVTRMTTDHLYRDAERVRNAAWKQSTGALPDAAREDAPYVGKSGKMRPRPLDFCLPPSFAVDNLLTEVRPSALTLFAELGIPWHAGVSGGPSNHLISSQVQCVNALAQMVSDPSRALRAFGGAVNIAQLLEIESGRFLTFEYIGPTDYFGESTTGKRIRGAHCTSVDAAILYRTSAGLIELALVEWKYAEEYRRVRTPDPVKDAVRWERYGAAWLSAEGPLHNDIVPFEDMLDEPFYQLMRQQLLAHELERHHVLGADRVRVVHVLAPGNLAYQQSLTRPSQRAVGSTVNEVWAKLLRRPDRFVHLDPALFLDPLVTSPEYVARYGQLGG